MGISSSDSIRVWYFFVPCKLLKQFVRVSPCKIDLFWAFVGKMSLFIAISTSAILLLNLLSCRFRDFFFIFFILFLKEFFLLFEWFKRFFNLPAFFFLGLKLPALLRLIWMATKFTGKIRLVFAFQLLLVLLKSFPFKCLFTLVC